jgi:hypothetical protein
MAQPSLVSSLADAQRAFLISAVNRSLLSAGPAASEETLGYFAEPFLRTVVARALASGDLSGTGAAVARDVLSALGATDIDAAVEDERARIRVRGVLVAGLARAGFEEIDSQDESERVFLRIGATLMDETLVVVSTDDHADEPGDEEILHRGDVIVQGTDTKTPTTHPADTDDEAILAALGAGRA